MEMWFQLHPEGLEGHFLMVGKSLLELQTELSRCFRRSPYRKASTLLALRQRVERVCLFARKIGTREDIYGEVCNLRVALDMLVHDAGDCREAVKGW
jgi:hypothetical protein